jgi:soluble lytic murein transglycosylase-like protein
MTRLLGLLFIVASTAAWASAQQPLSPPDRPPVPLSDLDQSRSRDEALQRQAAEQNAKSALKETAANAGAQGALIRIPPESISGHRITSGNAAFDSLAYEAADRYHLDPSLILAVMNAESGYNRMAVSPKGASGLMQLMPETATRFGVKNIFDPRENVLAGASYLRWLLDRFGDVRLALAGYNAGEGAVEFYGNRIPPFQETQNYVQIIYSRYSRIHGSAQTPLPDAARQPVGIEKPPSYNQIITFTSSTGSEDAQSLKK